MKTAGFVPVTTGDSADPPPTISNVAEEGVCVGCGACAIATESRISIRGNPLGFLQVDLTHASPNDLRAASLVCPFAHESVDEDRLAAEFIPAKLPHDRRIGKYLSVSAGRIASGDIAQSSSGGLTSWMTEQLLARGLVDGVIHVAASAHHERGLFEYCVSHTLDELSVRKKSEYYPISIVDAFESIKGNGKRYAFVGIPCFVKAARLIARHDAVIREQLAFCIGLVCGHLKSAAFAELLAWQVGVPPDRLARVDFRVKEPSRDSADYSFSAWSNDSRTAKTKPVRSLVGGDWGHAMFQLKSCDFCDDVFAETADISFGDAWLPEYRADWRGTNVVVNRHSALEAILREGVASKAIALSPLSPARAAASQEGNYRHRWDGLSVRLADDLAAGRWSPRKRIGPGSRSVSKVRERIVRLRRHLSETSHAAFREAKDAESLDHFLAAVRPLMASMAEERKRLGGPRPYILLRKWVGKALRLAGLRR